jgi:acyl-CoA reductase-like NAD-dependent aldehyde dehydrogenase
MITQEETIERDAALTLADRLAFIKLPIEERRRILAEQAEQMAAHYEDTSQQREREIWQGGDIVEY